MSSGVPPSNFHGYPDEGPTPDEVSAMKSWRVLLAASLAVGCTGAIGASNEPTGDPSSGAAGHGPTSGGAGAGVITGAGGADVTGVAGSPGVILPGGAGGAASCTAGVAVTSQVARLTNEQYDATVYDLLGVTGLKSQNGVAPSTILATDLLGSISDTGWSAYRSVADMIATQTMADATSKKKFMACTPSGDGKACLHDTIVKFGRRAFRRPLTTDEVAAFDAIVDKRATITATGSTDEVAQALLYMFLISPSFLMRAEVGMTTPDANGLYNLTSYEVASRLSYMLWGSMPDDTLAAAADNNQLTTPAQILQQAQRLVSDNRARDKVAAFHRFYTLMGTNTRWDNSNHDATIFPAFSRSLVSTLQAETEMFFDQMVFGKNATFQDLITSPIAYVTAATAPLYGLSAAGLTTTLKETSLSATQRPGFLTRLGFLNAYSSYNRSSPILRGAFITKQVLGTRIGSPPPGAEATALPTATDDLNTNRKQVDAQTSGEVCVTCHHDYINPPGFVMENFDAVGTWQTKERSNDVPIDTTVDMMIDGNKAHITSVSEMMAAIAASPMAQQRYAERWTSYAYEREGNLLDSCTVVDLAKKIAAGGYTVKTLITDLTQTTQFRTRAVGASQ
jgi:hypothetical protein